MGLPECALNLSQAAIYLALAALCVLVYFAADGALVNDGWVWAAVVLGAVGLFEGEFGRYFLIAFVIASPALMVLFIIALLSLLVMDGVKAERSLLGGVPKKRRHSLAQNLSTNQWHPNFGLWSVKFSMSRWRLI